MTDDTRAETDPRMGAETGTRSGPSSLLVAAVVALAVIAYFAVGTLTARDDGAGEAVAREPFVVLVRAATVEDRADLVSLRGLTEAGARVAVRAETTARVEAVLTREGAEVAPGAPLCRLEDAGRSAGLAEAEAGLVRARTEAEAAERLLAEGFAARAQADAARAALRAAEARRAAAAKAASASLIRSPLAGTITALPAEAGDVLAAGQPCAVVADLSRTLVVGELSAEEAASVAVGAPARAVVAGAQAAGSYEGAVRFVSPAAGPTGAFRVEIDLIEGGLPDGLVATAVIEGGRAGASLVPRAALVLGDDGALGLRVIEDGDGSQNGSEGAGEGGLVAFRPVRLVGEARDGAWVEGLSPGDRVIVRGQDYVAAGARVRYAVEGAAS